MTPAQMTHELQKALAAAVGQGIIPPFKVEMGDTAGHLNIWSPDGKYRFILDVKPVKKEVNSTEVLLKIAEEAGIPLEKGTKRVIPLGTYSDWIEQWGRRGAYPVSYDVERQDINLYFKRGTRRVGLCYNGVIIQRTWED